MPRNKISPLAVETTSDSFAAGSMAGTVNEIMNGAISRYEKAHPGKGLTPAEHQWISAAVGAIVNSATGSTIQTGAGVAVYGTKWNELKEIKEKKELAEAQKEMYERMLKELEISKSIFTEAAQKYEIIGDVLYASGKAIAGIGSILSEKKFDTPIASMLLMHALNGNGESLKFDFDSKVSNDLIASPILQNGIKKAADGLQAGETKYLYASVDFNSKDEDGNRSSRDEKLAYGALKVSIQITRDENNNVKYYGQVGDAYNFEYHNYNMEQSVRDFQLEEILINAGITLANNGATAYQYVGAIKPFTWIADIQGVL